MISALSIHMRSNPVAKWSHPSKGTCLDHIWSKSAVWQSPLTRGTFKATFGWSPLRDKVLQQGANFGPHLVKCLLRDKVLWQGANFGPHLVKVRCMTKSSDEGHILGHIWSKSAAWQSPPMRGTYWAKYGQSPLHDKVLQGGAHIGPHMVKVHCVTKSSDEGHILGHIWSKSAVRKSSPMRSIIVFATFGHCPLGDNLVWWPIMGIIFWPHLTKVRCVTCFPFYVRQADRGFATTYFQC